MGFHDDPLLAAPGNYAGNVSSMTNLVERIAIRLLGTLSRPICRGC